MTQPAKVQEPSMEEILASIRRIIADDEAKPAAAEKPASPPPAPAKPDAPAAAPAAKVPAMKDIPPSAIAPSAKPAAPKPAPPPPPAAPEPVVSNSQDDTDEMALPDPAPPPAAPPASSFHKIDPQDDIEFTEGASARALRPPAYEPPLFESAAAPAPQQILSRSTVSAVESAFNSLANTVLSNNARTLEDLVKEMLRPMLKSWLDDNLPGLVERIVKAEIERVSRGR